MTGRVLREKAPTQRGAPYTPSSHPGIPIDLEDSPPSPPLAAEYDGYDAT